MSQRLTELGWAACTDQLELLVFLLDTGRLGERKLRLFATACCRRVFDLLPAHECRDAVEVAEQFADGLVGRLELDAAFTAAHETHTGLDWGPYREAAMAAEWTMWPEAAEGVELVVEAAGRAAGYESAGANGEFLYRESRSLAEGKVHCGLLRDLVPYRRVSSDTAWLAWNHGTVPAVARCIYDERSFHDLPILADALEDAGCTHQDILNHCRQPGVHVRGCWVVDLLLGRE